MTNPFQYGGIVGKDAFCNRKQELHDVRRAIENADRMLVYAERRMGKTSLVKRVLAEMPKKRYLPIYVDLWATSDASSFATTLARAATEAAESNADKMLGVAREVFRHLVPSLTLDETGNPSIQFGARSGVPVEPQLLDAIDSPRRLAEKQDRRVVVVYDEVQRIAEYGDDLVERLLRSRIQEHQGLAYLFLGSRRHLVRSMFTDQSRPLFQAAGHYPLSAIAAEHWTPFIRERFEETGKPIDNTLIEQLCERTGGHPYYTQHLAHDLWEICATGDEITEEKLTEAEELLLDRLGYAYGVLWESLTANQKSILRGLAEEPDSQLFSAGFLRKHGLAGSSAKNSVERLMEKDVLDRENGSYVISDRFLRLWIRRL